MTTEEIAVIVEQAASKLGEHFDAVQILASFHDSGGTSCIKRGGGNWYARQGMAHEFINMDIAKDAAVEIAKVLQDDDK